MPPGMPRDQEALHLDAAHINHFVLFQKDLLIVHFNHRQLIQAMKDFPSHLARQIPVLDFSDVNRRIPEQQFAVPFQGSHVIRVLVGDEDLPNRRRIDIQPSHFFTKPGIIVPRVKHQGGPVLGVKENIGYPLAHAGHMLIDPSRVQRLEDRFSAEQEAHGLLLMFRVFPCHFSFSLSWHLFPSRKWCPVVRSLVQTNVCASLHREFILPLPVLIRTGTRLKMLVFSYIL